MSSYIFYQFFCTDPRQVPKPSVLVPTIAFPPAPEGADAFDFGGYTFDLSYLFEGENPPGPPNVVPTPAPDPGAPPSDPALWDDYYAQERLFIEYGAAKELYDLYQGQLDTDNNGTIDVDVTLPENFDPSVDPETYKPTPPGPPPSPDVEDYETKYNAWKASFDDWETKYRDYSVKKYWHDLYVKEAAESVSQDWVSQIMTTAIANRMFYRKKKDADREYAECIYAVMENAANEEKTRAKQEGSLRAENKKMEARSMQKAAQQRKAMEMKFINRMAQAWQAQNRAAGKTGKK